MNKYRLMDISFYYALKQKMDSLGIVNFREGFMLTEFEEEDLPLVVFDNVSIHFMPKELGSREDTIFRTYNVGVAALTKKQRDDILYELIDVLEQRIVVYNYNEGFPPDVIPSKIGCLAPEDLRVSYFTYGKRKEPSLVRYTGAIHAMYKFDCYS